MALVLVDGPTPERVEAALRAFEAEGWTRARTAVGWQEADVVAAAPDAAGLREVDARGLRYVLVHHGPDDGEPEGTYVRAHHRVELSELRELARRLRSRGRLLVTCLAFGFKAGIPAECAWVVDTRCLDNPYWVPELKPLDGRDPRVRDYVRRQPAAGRLLDGLEKALVPLLPEYRRRGRTELTVGFGCTGGRHRSVVLADAMVARLRAADPEVDVECRARELPA